MLNGVKVLQFHRSVGQYLLQRPHAALDISLPVHLSQTASATMGTVCRNLHPEADFLQRYCPPGGLEKCCCQWGNGISIGLPDDWMKG